MWTRYLFRKQIKPHMDDGHPKWGSASSGSLHEAMLFELTNPAEKWKEGSVR